MQAEISTIQVQLINITYKSYKMTELILRDVGDGLNLIIHNNKHSDLTVDFGGNKNLCWHCHFIDNFLLTHFHKDHYEGFSNCNPTHCYLQLDNFYFPAMPSFTDNKVFYFSLLAMNIRISSKFPIQGTILNILRKLNRKPLNFIPVAKDDIIILGSNKYEILWPPKELKEEETLIDIKRAIEDFEKAKESDPELNKIYKHIYEYFSDRDINEPDEFNYDFLQPKISDEVNDLVKKANDSLRSAANRLSVDFRQDDNILFLGDLKEKEILLVVDELSKNHNTTYDILISAHHGTHWHNCLNSITCNICLASVGQRLRNNIVYDYKNISNKFIRTDEWGDIRVSQRLKLK